MTRLSAPFLDDPALKRVLAALAAQGAQALVVGGAVRNALLGEPASDVDISTSARPQDTVRLAQAAGLRSVPTGIEHGTVTVIADGRGFEVTSFRRDVETDGRRAVVAYSDRIEDDAQRRDFTMNALYATASGEVLDPVGGLPDLAARRLRFVGDPRARIAEDYLRILRFFRLLAWYGREADLHALAACRELRQGLAGISRERIGHEMRKLLDAPRPRARHGADGRGGGAGAGPARRGCQRPGRVDRGRAGIRHRRPALLAAPAGTVGRGRRRPGAAPVAGRDPRAGPDRPGAAPARAPRPPIAW
ncbi:CCA tRNA nucleotidyltransferase, partial [Paracoccus thiocyanatus]|uniref:CCA tRNA nucleotidyltransferase n=1 Tax=Paracoccus thiocyanatus TaxID=34006 RepID=UPI0035AB6AB4